jgi:hypothetical protein
MFLALLEKSILNSYKAGKEIIYFHGARNFIIVFTTGHYDQSLESYPRLQM